MFIVDQMTKSFKYHTKKYFIRLLLMSFITIILMGYSGAQEDSLPDFEEIKINDSVRSLVIIDEARDAFENGDIARASELFNEAQKLSPNLPQIYFYLAKINFSFSSKGIFTSLSYLYKMLKAIFKNFWWSFYFFGFITISLSLTLYLSAICFIGIVVYAKFPLYKHDVKENWYNILLLVPAFLFIFVGPLFSMAALLLPFWIYLNGKQKTMSFISLVLTALLLLLLPALSVFSTLPNYHSFKDIVTISEGESTGFEFQSLKDDSRWESQFSLAIALKRKGNYDEAAAIYKKLLQKKKDPRLYNNLGNCYVAKGHHKTAMDYYKKAFEKNISAILLYNMSQVLREELDFKEAELNYEKARQLDPLLIPLKKEPQEQDKGLFVIDQTLRLTELWDLAFTVASDYSQTPYIKKSLSSLSVPLSLLLLVVVTLSILIVSKKRSSGTYQCRRCGSTYCPSCEKKVFSHSKHLGKDVCVLCFKTLLRFDELDPKKRIERLLTIQRFRNSRTQKFKLLELLIPGIGHLYYGKTVYGMPVFFLYIFFLGLFLFSLVITPFPLTEFTGSLFRWISVICLVLIYLFSLINTYRRPHRGWL